MYGQYERIPNAALEQAIDEVRRRAPVLVVGLEKLVVPGRRAPDAAEELPLVAEEPLLAVDAQEDEPARDEAQ